MNFLEYSISRNCLNILCNICRYVFLISDLWSDAKGTVLSKCPGVGQMSL